ncbi:MAG: peptide ABC transporter substrate-binding protein [Bacteriovoracia bacterium]
MRLTPRFLFAAVGLLFVSASPSPSPTVNPYTFTFRLSGEPATLDWNLAHTNIETYVLMNLMEGLVSFDQDMRVAPALAQTWTRSQDGKTYTFKLRPGVKWSDGVPLKAKDFLNSWRRLLSPLTAASYAYFLFDIEGAQEFNRGVLKDFDRVGVKAPDDQTLVVKLKEPVAHWIYMPTFWVTFPIRQDLIDKFGNGWTKPGNLVTLGPFTLFAYDIDAKIIMKANPLYAGARGNIQEVSALIVKDDATALNLYESGRLDFLAEISTLDLKRLANRADLKTFPYLKTGYLGFKTTKHPASNVKVRRAISMAIDKAKIGQILHGGQEPATTFVPPGVFAYERQGGLKYDPVAAKRELSASGEFAARTLKMELLTPNWDKQLTLAQFIQAELKKNLNIEVSVQPFDHKTFRAQLDLHAHPFYEANWGADYPDPDNFLSVFLGNSGNNRNNWKNARYDELVLKARFETKTEKRAQYYAEAQKILLEQDAVIVPLYYEPNKALVRSRVKGFRLNPLNYMYLGKVYVDGK